MKNSTMIPERIISGEIVTGILRLNNKEARDIALEFIKNVHPTDLITAGYLDGALKEIRQLIDKLDPNGTAFRELSMISVSLIDPFFVDVHDWILNNWYIQEATMRFTGTDELNSATINPDNYAANGKYLLMVKINSLPTGKLEILVNDKHVKYIHNTGPHYLEITLEDITTDRIRIVAIDVNAGDEVVLDSVSLHYVADRFYNYLIEKIRELSVVDTEDFVTRDEYELTLEQFIKQFEEITAAYLEKLNAHTTAKNPHGITPELIHAADKDHIHDNYVTSSDVAHEVEKLMSNYAPLEHEHAQYLTIELATQIVTSIILQHLSEMIAVDPMIITKAPEGQLPSRYGQTDLSRPVQIFVDTKPVFLQEGTYNEQSGSVTTNRASLMEEAPKVFCLEEDIFGDMGDGVLTADDFISFRLELHTARTVSGYKISCKGSTPDSWSVYSGSTEFIHTAGADVTFTGEDVKEAEILFDAPKEIKGLGFVFNNKKSKDKWELKIQPIYLDFTNDEFGITKDGFQFITSVKGSNKIVNVPSTVEFTKIKPIAMPEGEVYVYGGRELDNSEVQFYCSYIPPEYNNTRVGMPIFDNKFNNILRKQGATRELYEHPMFGNLILEHGMSDKDNELKSIYSSSEQGWCSNGDNDKITIVQTFASNHCVLRGYTLSWRDTEKDIIPDGWTLTLEGTDAKGKPILVICDSVDKYYPFYSVEDDDIVYHKHIDTEMVVSKLTLELTTESARKIGINKLMLHISERYYCIPENTMYYGLEPVAQTCLGGAVYVDDKIGWQTKNPVCGRSCVLPVNNMMLVKPFTEYKIRNPYHTKDVIADVHSYSFLTDTSSPAAFIKNVSAEYIHVYVGAGSGYYAVNITRIW